MAHEGGWRSHLFIPGERYVVRTPWPASGAPLKKGMRLVYDSCGWERYDGEMIFRFYTEQDRGRREPIDLHLRDSDPESKLARFLGLASRT